MTEDIRPGESETQPTLHARMRQLIRDAFDNSNNLYRSVEFGGLSLIIASVDHQNITSEIIEQKLSESGQSYPDAVVASRQIIEAMEHIGITLEDSKRAALIHEHYLKQRELLNEEDVNWYEDFIERVKQMYAYLVEKDCDLKHIRQ